jgi:SAM-dependent methyltransferase
VRVSTTPLTALDAQSLEHWRALCPTLHVEGGMPRPAFAIGDVDELVGQLRLEGYVNVPGVVEESVFEPLRDCIATLHRAGIPPAFAFVYDEFWHAFRGVSRFIEAALGKDYLALPDFWVWHLTPSEQAAGFGPHRDRVQPTLDPDDSPHSLTVWLPFSDATPLNGCIYVLPAQHDERFRRRVWDGPGNDKVEDLQNIRAVPAQAGSFLAWNQAILHWGGRASRRAEGPRTSAAFEFQRGDKPPFNEPLLDPQRVPSFAERLGLIGKQILQYRHMYPLAPNVERLAIELRDRFMSGVVSAVLPVSPSIERERLPYLPSNNRLPEQAAPLSLMTPNALAAEPSKPRLIDPKLLRESMARRLFRRSVSTGQITLPAVPGMVDEYVTMCDNLFAAVGSRFNAEELAHLRTVLEGQLATAYAATPRSTIIISYDSPVGTVLNYNIRAEWKTIAATYHDWIATREPPLFGTQPDARVWALANEAADPRTYRVLDIGAGTGRNALALARRGHSVDAVELTPKFAEMIRCDAERESLDVRVLQRDIFSTTDDLRQDYRLILLSEVVPEFRSTQELRSLFELAARCLARDGRLVFNAFLAHPEYTPDKAARELAEQEYTSIFTRSEMSTAAAQLPLELDADDSVYEYEKAHLPEGAWPPTSWYAGWITGLDVFDVEREQCPIEMRWLVFHKTS